MKCSMIILFLLVSGMILNVNDIFADKVFHGKKEIEYIPTLNPCNPGQNDTKPMYTETDDKGNKIEIWCTNGQYLMKFIDPNGNVVYVGECYFNGGQNRVAKQVRYGTITTFDNGTIIKKSNSTIIRTWWHNFEPINMKGMINGRDLLWFFNPLNNTVIRYPTIHNGTWVNSTYYHVNASKPSGPGTSFQAPSSPRGLLSYAVPSPSSGSMRMIPADYAFVTPIPITGMENGKSVTVAIKEPFANGMPIVQTISAEVNKPFVFDIDYPEESSGMVTYSLIKGPLGMTLGQNDGVLQWTPSSDEIGTQTVSVKMSFGDGTSDVETFTIPVVSGQPVASEGPIVPVSPVPAFSVPLYLITAIILIIVIVSLIVIWKLKSK